MLGAADRRSAAALSNVDRLVFVGLYPFTLIAKFAAQAVSKAAEIEWQPVHLSASMGGVLQPARLDHSGVC
jgi:hypothetical protein